MYPSGRYRDRMGPVGEVRSALVVACAGGGSAPGHEPIMELYRVLGDPALGGFQLSLLLEPSLAALRQELTRFLADRAPHDVVLVHLAGRVVLDGDGAMHLCTGADDALDGVVPAQSLPLVELEAELARCRSRRIVLLFDCAPVEATAPAGLGHHGAVALDERFRTPDRVVFTISTVAAVEALRSGQAGAGWPGQRSIADAVLLPVAATPAPVVDEARSTLIWTLVGVALLVVALPAMALLTPVGVALAAIGATVAVVSALRLAARERHEPSWHAPPPGEGIPFYQLYMLRRSQKSKDHFRHH